MEVEEGENGAGRMSSRVNRKLGLAFVELPEEFDGAGDPQGILVVVLRHVACPGGGSDKAKLPAVCQGCGEDEAEPEEPNHEQPVACLGEEAQSEHKEKHRARHNAEIKRIRD